MSGMFMPGGLEWVILALVALLVFILPLAALAIYVMILSKKKKQQIDAARPEQPFEPKT